MEKIFYKKTLIGIRITAIHNGSIPQTDPQQAVGILTFKHKIGAHFAAHWHKPKKRVTYQRQECFIVRRGKIAMRLFGPDNQYFTTITLGPGELFLAMAGGHDITVLEDCEVFEVKNGPYQDDKILIA